MSALRPVGGVVKCDATSVVRGLVMPDQRYDDPNHVGAEHRNLSFQRAPGDALGLMRPTRR
jgi:hypothetical protein